MKQTSSQPRLDGKIPGRIKYTFALGALGKDMIYGMIATFSMIYFTDIIKVNPVFIGVMFFVAKLWDAFNDLFMGMIVDNTRSRWGKFIPWLVIGTLVNSIVFVVLFTDFHLDGVGLCVFATAAYILGSIPPKIKFFFFLFFPPPHPHRRKRKNISHNLSKYTKTISSSPPVFFF